MFRTRSRRMVASDMGGLNTIQALLLDTFSIPVIATAITGTSDDTNNIRYANDTGSNIELIDSTAKFASGTAVWGQTALWYTKRDGETGFARPSGYALGDAYEFDIVADNDKAMLVGLSTTISAGGAPTDASTEHALLFNSDGNIDVVVKGVTAKADAVAYVNGTTYRARLVVYSTGCFYSISSNGGLTYTALYEDTVSVTAALFPVISNYNAVFNVLEIGGYANRAVSFADYVTDIPVVEADSLRDLFRRTTGSGWTNKTNWLSTVTADDWFGISLTAGKVSLIDIDTNNLIGGAGWKPSAFTGASLTFYAYTNANANFNFTLADLPALTGNLVLYLHSTSSVITGSLADLPALTGTLLFQLYSTSSAITGSLADLPALTGSLTLYLYSTSSVITGSLADLPALTGSLDLRLYSTSSVITGSLADLPALTGSLDLRLYSTSSAIIAGTSPVAWPAVTSVLVFADWIVSEVSDFTTLMYTDRALFTKNITVNISTTNAAPGGIYQAVCPPTSDRERIYQLVVDSCGGGFKKQTWTYTA